MPDPLVDAVGSGSGVNSGHTVALTINNNSNRVLYAFIVDYAQTGITSVTWNTSEALSVYASGSFNGAGDNWYIYRLINPTATTANLVTVYATSDAHILEIASLYNVDQTTPDDGADEAEGSGTAAQNTVTSATGDLALAFAASSGSSTFDPASGETEILDTASRGAAYTLAGAASVSFDITLGTSRAWVVVGLNINAVSGTTHAAAAALSLATTIAAAMTQQHAIAAAPNLSMSIAAALSQQYAIASALNLSTSMVANGGLIIDVAGQYTLTISLAGALTNLHLLESSLNLAITITPTASLVAQVASTLSLSITIAADLQIIEVLQILAHYALTIDNLSLYNAINSLLASYGVSFSRVVMENSYFYTDRRVVAHYDPTNTEVVRWP